MIQFKTHLLNAYFHKLLCQAPMRGNLIHSLHQYLLLIWIESFPVLYVTGIYFTFLLKKSLIRDLGESFDVMSILKNELQGFMLRNYGKNLVFQ